MSADIMNPFRHFLTTVAAAGLTLQLLQAALTPTDLRCEYLKDPLGIDLPKPRLSWVQILPNAA